MSKRKLTDPERKEQMAKAKAAGLIGRAGEFTEADREAWRRYLTSGRRVAVTHYLLARPTRRPSRESHAK